MEKRPNFKHFCPQTMTGLLIYNHLTSSFCRKNFNVSAFLEGSNFLTHLINLWVQTTKKKLLCELPRLEKHSKPQPKYYRYPRIFHQFLSLDYRGYDDGIM